jgi:hypothetical protein
VKKWLKDSSATGYLRSGKNIGKRIQDGTKQALLCENCEQLFSVDERLFAQYVFRPYVMDELDQYGVAQGKIKSISYDEWLLRFTISVLWRLLVHLDLDKDYHNEAPGELLKVGVERAEVWRRYLLRERTNTGGSDTHIFFLQSLSSVKGSLPSSIDERIDTYLLRTVDGSAVTGPRHMAAYAKLGPIALYSSILPGKLDDLRNTRIHKTGRLSTVQSVLNKTVAGFIFVNRLKEIFPITEYTPEQMAKVVNAMKQNPDRAEASMSRKVAERREVVRRKIDKRKENA